MDGAVSDEVIRRRLPPWMLGAAAATDKERDGNSKSKNDNCDVDDGCGSREDEVRVKKRGGRRPKPEAATQKKRDYLSDDLEPEEVEEKKTEPSAPAVKCEDRKRSKRKPNLDVEDAPKMKKQRGKAKKKNIQSNEDAMTGVCLENGEDEDLTVEDLMIFAKECVQEDTGAKEVESMKEGISGENQIGDIDRSGNSTDVQENKRPSEGQDISSSGVTTGNANATSEDSRYKPTMSGNPTEDMLNLFLGPLLKKTQEKEKKVDTEEMDFNFEMNRQNTSIAAIGEEQATVTKKKSSLRDRVAMFLD